MDAIHISIDLLIIHILPKLPVKSLLRFKSVSKSCKNRISSPNFVNDHLEQSNSNEILILTRLDKVYSVELNNPASITTISLSQTSLPIAGHRLLNVGSCNGILCFQTRINFCEVACLLLNPATQTYKLIHAPFARYHHFGFGYDHLNDDYKIVLVSENVMNIYSMKEASWRCKRNLGQRSLSGVHGKGALIAKHLIHWLYSHTNEYRICCFNLCSEEWETDVPFLMTPTGSFHTDNIHNVWIGNLDGYLCVSLLLRSPMGSTSVWVMKEYREHWVELSHPDIPGLKGVPLGFRQNSRWEILLSRSTSCLVWCDLRDQTIKAMKIDGASNYDNAIICNESLVRI